MAKYIRPVDYPVSGSFTDHVDRGSVNPGTDYATPIGTPVRAPAGGLISVVDNDAGGAGGRMIGLDTYDGDGFDFLHLDRLAVVAGQYVNQGDVIAYSGNTGTATTGPHLHMSFRRRQGSHFMNAGNEDFEAALLLLAAAGVSIIRKKVEAMSAVLVRINQGGAVTIWSTATNKEQPVGTPAEYSKLQEFMTVIGFERRADFDAFKAKYGPALIESGAGAVTVDPKPIAAAAEAGAKAGVTSAIPAIAKGVNDDSARRMQA